MFYATPLVSQVSFGSKEFGVRFMVEFFAFFIVFIGLAFLYWTFTGMTQRDGVEKLFLFRVGSHLISGGFLHSLALNGFCVASQNSNSRPKVSLLMAHSLRYVRVLPSQQRPSLWLRRANESSQNESPMFRRNLIWPKPTNGNDANFCDSIRTMGLSAINEAPGGGLREPLL